jgi:hypothetical protein
MAGLVWKHVPARQPALVNTQEEHPSHNHQAAGDLDANQALAE